MRNSFMCYDPLSLSLWHFCQRFLGKLIAVLALTLLLGAIAANTTLAGRRVALKAPPGIEPQPKVPAPKDDERDHRPPPSPVAPQGIIRLPHRKGIGSIAFSADSRILATGNFDSGCYLWDVASGKELWRAESVEAHGLAFSPDGRTLATGGWKGVVYFWDVKKREKYREYYIDKDIYTLAFSPNGRALAVGGRSNWVRLCDVHSGKEIRRFNGQGRIQSVAFSPDGTMLASATTGDRVHVWEIATGEEARPFRGKEIRGGCVAFSPDGRLLAIGQTQPAGTICVHEIGTGEVLRRISISDNPRFPENAYSLSFSPDGRALAAGGGPVVKVWGRVSGELLGKFEGHQGAVYRICFSPDGKYLAVGGSDKTVIIWDVSGRMNKEKIPSAALTPEEQDRLWRSLADKDAATAYRAVWDLCAVPEQSVPFLSERLRSATAFNEQRVKQLIVDLDSDRFEVRQRAEAELGKMAWVVEPALRQARQKGLSLEMRRRLTNLLQEIETSEPSASWLRMVRAIAVLERIGTPPAKRTLKTLADGSPETRLVREARGALQRLANEQRPKRSEPRP
jgi:WD40 repeat protein